MPLAKETGLPHTSHLEPGLSAYTNHGCRCDECRAIVRERDREKREARASANGGSRQQPYRPHTPKSETEDWKLRGSCITPAAVGVDFFPGAGEATDPAKRVCAGCPVRRECLTYALSEPRERFGIWGGTTARDRRSLTLAMVVGKPLPAIKFTDGANAAHPAQVVEMAR